jgi:putative peptidoglycan lipid II flippase
MIRKFLNAESKSISSASLILAISYLASAVLGLLRDRLLAGSFGAGNQLDVYYTAFTVPDFIALLLIFGAISAAVVPIFSSQLIQSKESAFKYLSNLMNVFIGFLIIVCLILIFATPLIVKVIAPGFSPAKDAMAISLMRIMFLSPIILGTSTLISSILQIFQRFLVTALAPVMYNLGIIVGIVFFVPRMGLVGLAWGVVLGGVLHLLIQLPALLSSGFKYEFTFHFRDEAIHKTIAMMVPRSIGLAAGQLNTIATTAIASTLVSGSIAIFNLANNVSSLMVNAVAVSVSTAAFPAMSMAFLQADDGFLKKFLSIARQIFFLTIPLSLTLIVLRVQVVRVFLGVGKFGWTDTRLTTACLGILAFNLTAQAFILFLSKSFYAAHNSKVPAIISATTVAFNIVLSLLFVWLMRSPNAFSSFVIYSLRLQGLQNTQVAGLALAYTITALVESSLLFYCFAKYFPKFSISHLSGSLTKIGFSSVVMVAATLLVREGLGLVLNLQAFWGVFFQLAISGVAAVISYTIAAYLLKSEELAIISHSLFKRFIANTRQ